jgi:hypothetical protein
MDLGEDDLLGEAVGEPAARVPRVPPQMMLQSFFLHSQFEEVFFVGGGRMQLSYLCLK